jgi:hypothetical protein
MSQEAAPAAAATAPPPHVLPVCYPSQGHVNPTLRFTKRLAVKGLLVTCCTTSGAGAQIAAAAASSPGVLSSGRDGDSVPVGLGRVRFKFLDDRGNEKDDLMRYFAMSAPAAFAELFGRQAAAGRPVACVVGNPFRPWVVDARPRPASPPRRCCGCSRARCSRSTTTTRAGSWSSRPRTTRKRGSRSRASHRCPPPRRRRSCSRPTR